MTEMKETNDVIALIDGLAEGLEKAKANGKLEVTDVQYLMPIGFLAWAAFKDFKLAVAELKSANGELYEDAKRRFSDAISRLAVNAIL